MSRVKQSRVNSSRNRTRLRATPEGRALHRSMVAKGRGPLAYFGPGVLRRNAKLQRSRDREMLRASREGDNAILSALSGMFRRKTG